MNFCPVVILAADFNIRVSTVTGFTRIIHQSRLLEMRIRRDAVGREKNMLLFFLLAASALVFGCRESSPVKGIELVVSFSEIPLTDRLYTDIQYRWRFRDSYKKIDQNCAVFVHFWHRSNLIFHDNHRPEIPVPRWEPGQEYTYTRRIYIPQFIDALDPEFKGPDTLKLSIGLSFPQDKSGKPLKKIYEKKLKVFPPPPGTPVIIYEDGWSDFEIDPESYLKRWRWTAKEARCIIDNPRRDALLMIRGGVMKKGVQDQKVIIKINNLLLDEFIPRRSHFERFYRIDQGMLGEEDRFSLVISTDKTFIPARVIPGSGDERELGIQVSFLYFR